MRRLIVSFVFVTLLVTSSVGLAAALPGDPPRLAVAQANPGWMTPDQAALLDVGIPALVPAYIPEPFADYAPAINTASGYYRLYWQVPGGTPTFLQVTGTLGGQIPAGSPYDLNNQLVVNSNVRGFDGYHDVTPVYDSVWWAEGNVVYSIQSRGLPTDAVSFANALMAVTPAAPAAAVPQITSPDSLAAGSVGNVSVSGAGAVTVTADAGTFSDTGTASIQLSGDATVSWVAPAASANLTVTFSVVDTDGTVLTSTQTLVTGTAPVVAFGLACPGTVGTGDDVPISVSGSGSVTVYASSGAWPVRAPNTDVDPSTNGASVSFPVPASGSASLIWSAPPSEQTASIFVTISDGTTVADCQVYVAPAAVPTSTLAAPAAPPTDVSVSAPTAVSVVTAVAPTATAAAPVATAGAASGPGGNQTGEQPTAPEQPTVAQAATGRPGDGIAQPGGFPAPTTAVRPGDGIPANQMPTMPAGPDGAEPSAARVSPTMTPGPGDGTGFEGVATAAPTWPVAPTSAPLPSAPPTSAAGSADMPAQITATRGATVPVPVGIATVPAATATVPTATRNAPQVAPAATLPATVTATVPVATATATIIRPTGTAPQPTAPTPRPTVSTPQPTATASTLGAAGIPIPTRDATQPPTPSVVASTATRQAPGETAPVPTPTRKPKATATSTPDRGVAGSAPSPTATVTPTTTTATAIPSRTATPTASRSDSASRGAANPFANGLPVGGARPSGSAAAPTAVMTAAPSLAATPLAAEVSQMIPVAGGSMTAPGGAMISVDADTFDAPVTVTVRRLPDSALPVSNQVDLVSGTGYDIGIVKADGNALTTLSGGVSLSLPVPEPQRQRATLYWINGDQLEQVGVSNTNGDGIVSPLTHLSSYVAGVPVDQQPSMGWLPWIIAIAAALSGFVIVGLLANASRTSGAYRRRQARA